ncbi:MAG: ankyrin repeat domain-containing protein [Chlamydiota bacterium]
MYFFNIKESDCIPVNYDGLKSQNVFGSQVAQQSPTSTKPLSRAGQRRLRTEVVSGPFIRAVPDTLVEALVKYGNNPDGIPALHAAIKSKDENAVKLLLDWGADPNAKAPRGWGTGCDEIPTSALDFAAAFANPNLVNLLIDRGAVINPPGNEITPLMCAAKFNNSENILCLVQRGADLYLERAYQWNALHIAVVYDSTKAIETLISLGISPNIANIDGMTPLMQGCYLFRVNPSLLTMETLLRMGANPNLKRPDGKSPLHFLVTNLIEEPLHCLQLAEILIRYKADINARDLNGKTPLFYVSDPVIQAWLIKNGATL